MPRFPALFSLWAECWYVWRMSRRMLATFRDVRRGSDKAIGHDPQYLQVLQRALDLDAAAAQAALGRARESFCIWPAERSLRLRDVVHYASTQSYLQRRPDRHGMRADVGRIVAHVIPYGL